MWYSRSNLVWLNRLFWREVGLSLLHLFIKQFKLALPAGKQVGQSDVRPDLLEVRYDKTLALTLVKTHLQATENIWRGTAYDDSEITGFKSFLSTLEENQLIESKTKFQES